MVKRSREVLDLEKSSEIQHDPTSQADSSGSPSQGSETKLVHLDPATSSKISVIHCSLPGHRPSLPFTTFSSYDLHYAKSHLNRCLACSSNFPTPHLLFLHQSEFHDPLAQVRRDRGEKIFKCFVEVCEKVCMTERKRRSHLVDGHGFPRNYEWRVVEQGVDGRRSLLREERPERTRRRSLMLEKRKEAQSAGKIAENAGNVMDIDQKETERIEMRTQKEKLPKAPLPTAAVPTASSAAPEDAIEIDELVGVMSALRFVPPSVRFGKGKGRPNSSKN